MNIHAICRHLEDNLGCIFLSPIASAPPSDIDIFVPEATLPAAIALAQAEGFVLTSTGQGQHVFRRFEDGGKLYILDLMTSFDVYARHVATLELSPKGHATIGASPSLHKSFKYLCLQQAAKIPHIALHHNELAAFLCCMDNFICISPAIIAAAYGPIHKLMEELHKPVWHAPFTGLFIRHRLLRPLRDRLSMVGRGRTLAFVGPDGSGKSFMIDHLEAIGRTRKVYMGDWFFKLQPLYNRIMKIPTPYNRFIYLFYYIENMIRRLHVGLLRLLGYIVLIDRFPGTNRNIAQSGLLGKINRFTFRSFTKPDIMIFLMAPPETIFNRKQELTIKEIARYQAVLSKLLSSSDYIEVDTTATDAALNRLLAVAFKAVPE